MRFLLNVIILTTLTPLLFDLQIHLIRDNLVNCTVLNSSNKNKETMEQEREGERTDQGNFL